MTKSVFRAGRSLAPFAGRAAGYRGALAAALLATSALSAPALAQTQQPSVYSHVDPNGVDMVHGSFNFTMIEGSIGSGESALTLTRSYGRSGWTDGLPGRLHRSLYPTNNRISLTFGNRAEYFTLVGGVWTPDKADGATLTGSGNSYTYRAANGTVVEYGLGTIFPIGAVGGNGIQYCTNDDGGECELLPLSVTEPGGRRIELQWEIAQACDDVLIGQTCNYFPRLSSITNHADYVAAFSYATDTYGSAGPSPDWFRRTGAQLSNTTVPSSSWPTIIYAQPTGGVTEVTDMAGRTWRFSQSSGSFAIRRPGSASDDVVVTRDSAGVVSQVTAGGITTNYARSVSGSTATMTVTNALSQQTVVTSDLNIGRPTSATDPLGRTTSFLYDTSGRLTRTVAPEGNELRLSYDARGNVTEQRSVARPGSGLADIIVSASYDASCANPVTCNSPNSTTDARGHVTDFTYDATHGGLLTVTLPAAPNGVRPQTRYGYTLANGVHRLTQVSACRTQASCAGTADEVRTTFGHDAQGNVTAVTTGAGDGSLTAAQAMTYDGIGNLLTVDGPLPGSADTSRYRYNQGRELIGTVGPDPDGAGPLQHRAMRNIVDARGLVARVDVGTVADQSDGAFANMSVHQSVEQDYDSHARPTVQRLTAGGTTYALTQASYDALGRPDCSALRMNPAAFGSLPASACTLGSEGAFGPDRISRTLYDAAGQVIELRNAVGTADEAAEAGATYTPNGQVETLTDGEGNRTTYVYDGHGRLSRTFYPVATVGANTSSTTDYEELGYDPAGNVTSRRTRAGQTIGYGYDALNRLTSEDLPQSVSYEYDRSYGYDLLGRLTSASHALETVTFGYDALGRMTGESSAYGTKTSSYDLAGRRTRLTHPDGFFVDYDYLVTGEMHRVRENGATSGVGVLATYGYDQLGRRTSLTRGNGTVTSYAHDAVSRLAGLGHDLAGSAQDLSLGFTHNPAGQIASNTRSNAAYSFTGLVDQSRTDTVNGRNQLTQAGSDAVVHDDNGNIIGVGSQYYVYTADNRLRMAVNQAQTHDDPLGRLRWVVEQPANLATNFDHDAGTGLSTIIAEYGNDNAMARRFVHGAGTDEPLVEYQGSGSADRRFLHADERGSIVAHSDSTGTVTAVNRYDEYGQPQAGNVGRFQYTGQAWIEELGMYHYRARWYHPRLGRFMQTDPIGYGDGMNLYAYVGGDPVNRRDPRGLEGGPIVIEACRWGRGVGGNCMSAGEATELLNRISFQGGFRRECSLLLRPEARGADCPDLGQPFYEWPFPPAVPATPAEQPCPAGPRFKIGLTLSLTLFIGDRGISGGFEGGIAIPADFFSNGSLRGMQAYGSVAATGLGGRGAFLGGGGGFAGGYSTGPLTTGGNSERVLQGGIGRLYGAEALVVTNRSNFTGDSAISGGVRPAIGGYFAAGERHSLTYGTSGLGC